MRSIQYVILLVCCIGCVAGCAPTTQRTLMEQEFHVLTQYYDTPQVVDLFQKFGKDFAIYHTKVRTEQDRQVEDRIQLFGDYETKRLTGTYQKHLIVEGQATEQLQEEPIEYVPEVGIQATSGVALAPSIQNVIFLFQVVNLQPDILKNLSQDTDPRFQHDGQFILAYQLSHRLLNVYLGAPERALAQMVLLEVEATDLTQRRQELVVYELDGPAFVTESVYATEKK